MATVEAACEVFRTSRSTRPVPEGGREAPLPPDPDILGFAGSIFQARVLTAGRSRGNSTRFCFHHTWKNREKRTAGSFPVAHTNLQVVRSALEHGDPPLMLQLTRERVRAEAVRVSPERCSIDRTALWQFATLGPFYFGQRFEHLYVPVCEGQAIKVSAHFTLAR